MKYKKEIIDKIKDILMERNESIAVAESVTAGHLQAALSSAIDASKFFQGGITTYNLGQKARHLKIDPILGQNANCVDRKIAGTMAIEVAKLFSSDFSIAITGYASMVPESNQQLFAYFCIVHDNKVVLLERIETSEKDPYEVQVDYTNQVLHHFVRQLSERE
jgi:PncC family amidohydrolase